MRQTHTHQSKEDESKAVTDSSALKPNGDGPTFQLEDKRSVAESQRSMQDSVDTALKNTPATQLQRQQPVLQLKIKGDRNVQTFKNRLFYLHMTANQRSYFDAFVRRDDDYELDYVLKAVQEAYGPVKHIDKPLEEVDDDSTTSDDDSTTSDDDSTTGDVLPTRRNEQMNRATLISNYIKPSYNIGASGEPKVKIKDLIIEAKLRNSLEAFDITEELEEAWADGKAVYVDGKLKIAFRYGAEDKTFRKFKEENGGDYPGAYEAFNRGQASRQQASESEEEDDVQVTVVDAELAGGYQIVGTHAGKIVYAKLSIQADALYTTAMLKGVIPSGSTGSDGIKFETDRWAIKITISQAQSKDGLDNTWSPYATPVQRNHSQTGKQILKLDFNKSYNRH